MAIEKKSKSVLPIHPIYLENCPNGQNWQCFLAGNSKTAPRILILSIAIGADYSYEMKISEIWVPAFFKHNNSLIATVHSFQIGHYLHLRKSQAGPGSHHRLFNSLQHSQIFRSLVGDFRRGKA